MLRLYLKPIILTRDVFKLIVGDLAENLCIGVIDNGDQRYVVHFSNKGLITVQLSYITELLKVVGNDEYASVTQFKFCQFANFSFSEHTEDMDVNELNHIE